MPRMAAVARGGGGWGLVAAGGRVGGSVVGGLGGGGGVGGDLARGVSYLCEAAQLG